MFVRFGVGLLGVGVLAGIGCGTNAAPGGLSCGPGTHQEGALCLPDAPPADDPAPDAGTSADGGTSPDAGPGPIVHQGDPCPSPMQDACADNKVFHCNLIPGSAGYGTLAWDWRSCDTLGGTCVVENGTAHCTGGGYTACDPRTDRSHCVDDRIVADCSGAGWYGIDCALSKTPEGVPYVCKTVDMSDTAGYCAPP